MYVHVAFLKRNFKHSGKIFLFFMRSDGGQAHLWYPSKNIRNVQFWEINKTELKISIFTEYHYDINFNYSVKLYSTNLL